MKFLKKVTLPVTKYRKHIVEQLSYKLDNGLLIDVVIADFGISTVLSSTQVSEHASVEDALAFLLALEHVDVFTRPGLDFNIVKDFVKSYHKSG